MNEQLSLIDFLWNPTNQDKSIRLDKVFKEMSPLDEMGAIVQLFSFGTSTY